jgi:hypothetical protein
MITKMSPAEIEDSLRELGPRATGFSILSHGPTDFGLVVALQMPFDRDLTKAFVEAKTGGVA